MKTSPTFTRALCFALAGLAFATALQAQPQLQGLRGSASLTEEAPAPLMPKVVNDDLRRQRAHPMQPPVVPHQIDGYQVDANFNKCMSCHSRERAQEARAPMVSVTHFSGRDNQVRADISPRRYFCTQCHVVQLDVTPPVRNTYQDASTTRKALGVKP
jgi:nitrate reductase (cytochrome), electron transfer subunit